MKLDRYRLDVLMGERGLTLGDLAKAADMTRQNLTVTLSRDESQPKTLARISKALGVSLAEITKPD